MPLIVIIKNHLYSLLVLRLTAMFGIVTGAESMLITVPLGQSGIG
jgi:hypothetical protein